MIDIKVSETKLSVKIAYTNAQQLRGLMNIQSLPVNSVSYTHLTLPTKRIV